MLKTVLQHLRPLGPSRFITSPRRGHPLAAWWPCGAQGKVVRMQRCNPRVENLTWWLPLSTDTFHDCSDKEVNQEGRHGMW